MIRWCAEYVWLVPCYGLLGAVLTLPWAAGLIRRTGPRPAAYLNVLMTLLALLHSLVVCLDRWGMPPEQLHVTWLHVEGFQLSFALEVSAISSGAAVLVSTISLFAQFYGLGSMETDWAMARLYALMGFFEGAMSGVALSGSLFLSYALLEMLTLSTYLLVGFWYAQPLAVPAARDAFWTKRVGDLILLIGVVWLSTLTASLDFADLAVWAQQATLSPAVATWLGLALMAGPVGKCAQFPLHLWLDEAMEGPNPASVLRNSAVVACGAYVLIELEPILSLSPVTQSVLVIIGTVTAIGSALVSIAQVDLKRALSHTTSTYLGLVFVAVGLGQIEVALFLLLTHAIAKALVFMGVGGVMMATNTQDLREMGGIGTRMPVTVSAFAVGALSLIGLVPLGGFWAMYAWLVAFWQMAPWAIALLLAVNALLSVGLMRVFTMVFLGRSQPKSRRTPEVGWPVALPAASLTVVALLVPVALQTWHLLPAASDLHWGGLLLLVLSSFLGLVAGGSVYLWDYATGSTVPLPPQPVRPVLRALQDMLADDLYVNTLYRTIVVAPIAGGGRAVAWIDRYVVDGAVNLLGLASILSGETLKYTASGRSQQYLLTILVGLLLAGLFAFWSLSH